MRSTPQDAFATRFTEVDDERLMSAIQGGSVEAFEAFCERYLDRAYEVAWWICGEPGNARDAVEETFASVWLDRRIMQVQRGSVAAWLLSAVIDRALRDAADTPPTDEEPAGASASVAATADLHSVALRLPPTQRAAIGLALYGRLSCSEIATAIGVPTRTIKGRLRQGLATLNGAIG